MKLDSIFGKRLVRLPNYKIYSTNWIDKISGGVCILACCKLQSRQCQDLNVETNLLEHCIVQLKTDTRNILLVSGYRDNEIIIGIDHNLELLKANSHSQTNEFLELNLRKSLLPCISKPTRITHTTGSLIDNIMVRPILQCNYLHYILVDNISDHMPIIVKLRNQNKLMKGLKIVKHHRLDSPALDKINHDIASEDWPQIFSGLDTNNSFNMFHKKLISSICMHLKRFLK